MTTIVIDPATEDIQLYVNQGIPGTLTETSVSTLTNKTMTYADNTLTGVQEELVSGTSIKTINSESLLGSGNIATLTTDLSNEPLQNIKTISFFGEGSLTQTSGAISIDWTAAQNYVQTSPTGGITYTFVDPPGPCHLQLRTLTGGTAQAVAWPGNVSWLEQVWAAVANRTGVINLWFDGTNYVAMGNNTI